MTVYASGSARKTILGIQGSKGTIAAVDLATAQYLRRVTFTPNMKRGSYVSNEIREDRQVSDMRLGVKSYDAALSGELSPGTYQRLMAALLRQAWQTQVTTGAVATITAAATTGAAGTFTMSGTGAFLTAGFKVGDVVRWSGWSADALLNNAHNFYITALTASIMTVIGLDGVPPVAHSEGDSVTGVVTGKKTWAPTTGHTKQWFTVEDYFSDIDLSDVYWDMMVANMAISVPGSGIATINAGFVGLQLTQEITSASPYFTAVLPSSTYGDVAAVNGSLVVNGAVIGYITGIDFSIDGGLSASEGCVGSNVLAEIFDGNTKVSGNLKVYLTDMTYSGYFANETVIPISVVLTTGSEANADFIAFTMPRCKVGGADKDDAQTGITQTVPFTALINTTGGAATGATATNKLTTTISVQDSTQ